MKKFKLPAVLLFCMFFNSCKKDEIPPVKGLTANDISQLKKEYPGLSIDLTKCPRVFSGLAEARRFIDSGIVKPPTATQHLVISKTQTFKADPTPAPIDNALGAGVYNGSLDTGVPFYSMTIGFYYGGGGTGGGVSGMSVSLTGLISVPVGSYSWNSTYYQYNGGPNNTSAANADGNYTGTAYGNCTWSCMGFTYTQPMAFTWTLYPQGQGAFNATWIPVKNVTQHLDP